MKKWLIGAVVILVLGATIWASLRDAKPKGSEVEVQAAVSYSTQEDLQIDWSATPAPGQHDEDPSQRSAPGARASEVPGPVRAALAVVPVAAEPPRPAPAEKMPEAESQRRAHHRGHP